MANRFKTEEVSLGNKLIVEGEDLSKFFIIAQGQVEVLSKGAHGSDLRIALLTEGEYFGETDLVSDKPSDVTVRTITPCVLLTLSRKDLDAVLGEDAGPERRIQEGDRRASGTAVRRSIATANGTSIWCRASPRTSRFPRRLSTTRPHPREYSLSAVQTVVRVHTRVSDLYNGPVRSARRADAADDRGDQGAAGMGADQQQEVRPDPLGRSGDADQHALRSTDAGRSGRTAGTGLEEAGVLPGTSEGDCGLRTRMHLAGRTAGDDEPVRHCR